ncbi:MAG TPA: molybdopterin-dependent oxidoreductase [Thermoanaerobaculales bacterium]|nr:molybdopterin-dependent oxidoreductase [Thermoanaerobaculales bacterium]HQL29265.1 molybdopterin-dependent oxidoreductase [Thermoanaerobaculales bacterium]
MKHLDTAAHTRGEAPFIADLDLPPGCLHAAVVESPVPHAHRLRLDASVAEQVPGVVRVLTAADIPGDNQIGGVILDEPLLADGALHFAGQPVAMVVAESPAAARRGAAAVTVSYEELPGVFDPREAAAAGQLIMASRMLECGDVDAAWPRCDVVVSGRVDSGGQEHLYFETQSALALPLEAGRLRLLSATQSPTLVQRVAARVLGLPMNAVEVEVTRLGGAFGGKEDQATAWAVLAALACHHLRRPVRLVLDRGQDMRATGKRHPYSSDFKLGLAADGTMLAYQATYYQNAGAAADLSPAILERSLLHASGSYLIPNARITAHSCRTNLPPFTAMRGFGAPQAMFVIESAIAAAARAMGVPAADIQRRNLLAEGDPLPYGMRVERSQARRSFAELEARAAVAGLRREIEDFNRDHALTKRGLALMPVCFGISFTSTFLNQASALVHVYTDGSVSVSTAAVEMGQGVNTKIAGIAARTLGVSAESIRIETTNTTRVANTSPTAASSGADMNGRAAELACRAILDRLLAVAADLLGVAAGRLAVADCAVLVDGAPSDLDWQRLVWTAYTRRVSLSAQAHYATPNIHYDRSRERGKPFAYHVFGAAAVEVTVDCLRGTYTVDKVWAVHDAGRSLNPLIDRGQLEGGLVQGLGWMTCEELLFDRGRLLSGNLTNYKIPDLMATPEIDAVFLDNADNPHAVLSSKAIGEPPLMYGIGAYFALLDAMKAFRPDLPAFFSAPMTPERVLMALNARAPRATAAERDAVEAVHAGSRE